MAQVILRTTAEALAAERAAAKAAAERAKPTVPSVPPSDLLDATPYNEASELSPAVRALAVSLIEAEMRTFAPPDYFEGFPAPTLSFAPPSISDGAASTADDAIASSARAAGFLASEMKRVAEGRVIPALNVSERYSIAPPSRLLQGDANAWRQATRVAERVAEHQRVRCVALRCAPRARRARSLWTPAPPHTLAPPLPRTHTYARARAHRAGSSTWSSRRRTAPRRGAGTHRTSKQKLRGGKRS